MEIIVGTLPASPTLAAPANNATEIALSPTLSWNAVSNAVSYTLQVSTSNSFSSFVYNQSGLTNTSQLISGLNIATTYYWHVNSTNIYGTSSWATAFTFKTVTPPQAPTLSTPTNNATEVALSPTLTWNAVSNTVSYILQVSANNSFSSFVYNQSGLTNTNQQITGLNSGSEYYWRVNATNIYGTSGWSSIWTFGVSVPCPGLPTVSYAGRIYNTVQIGTQCWLKENLYVGTMIQGNQISSNNGTIEMYCPYNEIYYCNKYGGYYPWDEAMNYSKVEKAQGICPSGWHIPTEAEMQILKNSVNSVNALLAKEGNVMAGPGTNTSGFSALAAGAGINWTNGPGFFNIGNDSYFWSSTENDVQNAIYLDLNVNIYIGKSGKELFCSIRCIKD